MLSHSTKENNTKSQKGIGCYLVGDVFVSTSGSFMERETKNPCGTFCPIYFHVFGRELLLPKRKKRLFYCSSDEFSIYFHVLIHFNSWIGKQDFVTFPRERLVPPGGYLFRVWQVMFHLNPRHKIQEHRPSLTHRSNDVDQVNTLFAARVPWVGFCLPWVGRKKGIGQGGRCKWSRRCGRWS